MNTEPNKNGIRVPRWVAKILMTALVVGVLAWVGTLNAGAVKNEGRMSTLEATTKANYEHIKTEIADLKTDVSDLKTGQSQILRAVLRQA